MNIDATAREVISLLTRCGLDACAGEPCLCRHTIIAALNSVRSPVCRTWQPIETAPKDGTRVLLVEADQPGEACVGWWMEGAWRDFGDIGCNGLADYQPTHWMALPLSPALPEDTP